MEKRLDDIQETMEGIKTGLVSDLRKHLNEVSAPFVGGRELFLKKLSRHETSLAKEEAKLKDLNQTLADKELELFKSRDLGEATEALQKEIRGLHEDIGLVEESIADLKEKHIEPCKEDLKAARHKLREELKKQANTHRLMYWNAVVEEMAEWIVDIAFTYNETWQEVSEKLDARVGRLSYSDMPLPSPVTPESRNRLLAYLEGRLTNRDRKKTAKTDEEIQQELSDLKEHRRSKKTE